MVAYTYIERPLYYMAAYGFMEREDGRIFSKNISGVKEYYLPRVAQSGNDMERYMYINRGRHVYEKKH